MTKAVFTCADVEPAASVRLREMAPAVISCASENDPTTVASLAVIGSTTVYALGWLVLLSIPMLAVVQSINTQIGAATKCGLEDLVRRRYGRPAALLLLFSVLAVNTITLAADLEGGGAAIKLLCGIDYHWWIVPLAVLSLSLLVFGTFSSVQRVLVYLPLAFLAYIFAAFMAHPKWVDVLRGSFVPHVAHSHAYIAGALALLGTTLTAYSYVWQEIETSEDPPPLGRLRSLKFDALVGAGGTGIVFWFIVIATGATLGVHHKDVQTAEEAAQALAPIAGRYATTLFGIGLLGSALLAIPVLLATSAYVVSEMFGWVGKLDSQFFQARRFYWAMIVCALAACALAYAGFSPITLLFAGSIAGGIATPVSLAFCLLAAQDKAVMHGYTIGPWLRIAGWATTAVITVAAVIYLYQTATGQS